MRHRDVGFWQQGGKSIAGVRRAGRAVGRLKAV